MGEGRHEDDGGVGDDGLEDATVPAGGKAKKEAGEEHRGNYYCCHRQFLFRDFLQIPTIWQAQRKPFPKKREKAGSKDEQEPWRVKKVNFGAIEVDQIL